MIRRALALAVVAALVAPVVDLQACGDKFLRAGRSPRMKRYAAMYPAVILLYPSASANRDVVDAWQKMLKDAGHKPRLITRRDSLVETVAAGAYDLVITDYGSAARVRSEVLSAPTKPGVLPVLSDSSKASQAKATAEFEHFLDPSTSDREKLAEIDHVMELRLRETSAHSRP
jgi:hypothetical protein